jgi:hypothetical protein
MKQPTLGSGLGPDDAGELLVEKIRDALRDGKSERHLAKLLGVSRALLWRAKMMSQIRELPALQKMDLQRKAA